MTPQLPSRAPSAPAVSYTTGDQVPATESDGQGRPVRGVRVYYTTAGGIPGSVFIAENRFTPDNVRAAIVAKVAVHDQVQALKG